MTRTTRLFVALGLAISAGIAAPGCVVRGSGYVGASTTPVVYQEPPQAQVEEVSVRPGYLFVRGRWDWQNGQWAWIGGHWEAERAGYGWSEGRWERRGNAWHWIEGTWSASASGTVVTTTTTSTDYDHDDDTAGGYIANPQPANTMAGNPNGGATVTVSGNGASVSVSGGMYPTAAPPPVRVESYGSPRAGFLWVTGRWDWRNGNWAWVDGHWERERANMMWNPGRWELQGNYYVWVEGRWDRAPAQPTGPVVRDHR